MPRLLLLFSCLLLLLGSCLGEETVTISSEIPSGGHDCIEGCLYYTFGTDMGAIMGCDLPYENACYCATASASVSVADNWMSRCASSQCGRGDYTRDLSSMQSIYASYCVGAGFTQPGATAWYNPAEATTEEPSSATSATEEDSATSEAAPSRTEDSGAAETTTQVTIVTQTTEGGSAATKTQVIVQATSTLWVNSDGSPASLEIDDGNDNSSVKIGVGVAIPVIAIIAAAFGFWFWRRRRRNAAIPRPSEEAGTSHVSTYPPLPMSTVPVARKPVGSSAVSPVSAAVSPVTDTKTNELSGEGLKREIDGQQVHPFVAVTSSPPIEVGGRHEANGDTALRPEMTGDAALRTEMDGQSPRVEVSGEGRPPELHGQSQSPPPVYTQSAEQQPVQRWELPDNSR